MRADDFVGSGALGAWRLSGSGTVASRLLVKSAEVRRFDLPDEAEFGARAYVPDCPRPESSIVEGRGAECMYIGEWVRLGDYGDIYLEGEDRKPTPVLRLFSGRDGIIVKASVDKVYQSVDLSVPVTETGQSVAAIQDEGPNKNNMIQPTQSARGQWAGDSIYIDGSDDSYSSEREIRATSDTGIFIVIAYRRIAGNNNYYIATFRPLSGIEINVGTRHGDRIYYILRNLISGNSDISYTDNNNIKQGDIFVFGFEISKGVAYTVGIDGERKTVGTQNVSVPEKFDSSSVLRIFYGQPEVNLLGFSAISANLTKEEKMLIIRDISGI